MDIDFEISKAAFAIRLMERAVHDRSTWTLKWGSKEVEANRGFSADGHEVRISGEFDSDICHLVRPEPVITLWSDGELLASKPLTEDPGDGGFTFDLRLTVSHSIGADV